MFLKKNSPHVHNKIASALHGPQTGSRGSGRQARSLRGEDQWFGRDSQLHIIGQSPAPGRTSSVLGQGRKAPGPLGNIQIFTRSSSLVTKTDKKAYSRLFTNSIWDITKAEVGWLGRVGSVGTEQPQQPRGSRAGAPPQAPGSARHWTLSLGEGLNSSCGGTSFCCPNLGETYSFRSVPCLGVPLNTALLAAQRGPLPDTSLAPCLG